MKWRYLLAALLAANSALASPANVTIKRDAVFGQWWSIVLYVDGKPFAHLASAESKTFSLPPGEHVLAVRKLPFNSPLSEVALEPKLGKHYSFRITYGKDGYTLQSPLTP
jgi:hypothetical protein